MGKGMEALDSRQLADRVEQELEIVRDSMVDALMKGKKDFAVLTSFAALVIQTQEEVLRRLRRQERLKLKSDD